MDSLKLPLFISVILNVLLLRWAFSEYHHRRQWQKEAISLQKVLRSINQGAINHDTARISLGWLLAAILLVLGVIWSFIVV